VPAAWMDTPATALVKIAYASAIIAHLLFFCSQLLLPPFGLHMPAPSSGRAQAELRASSERDIVVHRTAHGRIVLVVVTGTAPFFGIYTLDLCNLIKEFLVLRDLNENV